MITPAILPKKPCTIDDFSGNTYQSLRSSTSNDVNTAAQVTLHERGRLPPPITSTNVWTIESGKPKVKDRRRSFSEKTDKQPVDYFRNRTDLQIVMEETNAHSTSRTVPTGRQRRNSIRPFQLPTMTSEVSTRQGWTEEDERHLQDMKAEMLFSLVIPGTEIERKNNFNLNPLPMRRL
jgi:hypothetical protein